MNEPQNEKEKDILLTQSNLQYQRSQHIIKRFERYHYNSHLLQALNLSLLSSKLFRAFVSLLQISRTYPTNKGLAPSRDWSFLKRTLDLTWHVHIGRRSPLQRLQVQVQVLLGYQGQGL